MQKIAFRLRQNKAILNLGTSDADWEANDTSLILF